MLNEAIQKDCEKWLDQEWPEWRHPNNALDVHRIRRTYEAAYLQGRQDEADTVSACLV